MAKNIATIPPGTGFVDALAEGLWREAAGDTAQLAALQIFLPTRRACLHLREAFLNHTEGRAALLPRMQPLGDIDDEELYFADSDLNPDIPPAITPLRRHMLLTRLISARDTSMPCDQAAQLADALAHFLDEAQIHRADFWQLAGLVERQDLAEHWRQTVQFLEILTKEWPKILADEGCIDPADRRNRVLEAQAAAWKAKPPSFRIIAAGSTGTMPATADFLDAIASLPNGTVVLPGLDQTLDEEAWQAIDESHPQHGMKLLLEKMGVARKDVKPWASAAVKNPARLRLLQEAMRPAEVTEAWRDLRSTDIPAEALHGLSALELDHPQEEAQAIALIMRGSLEAPDKTVALVTPDRDLAERVAAMLTRWGIAANDSGGASLAARPVGAFLLGVLDAAAPDANAVDILTLLKHPFSACGETPATCRAHARHIEIAIWRDPKPDVDAETWLHQFRKSLQPITNRWKAQLPLTEWLALHIRLAEQIAASDEATGSARLWQDEEGEAAAEWLDDWRRAAHDFPPLSGADYRNLFAELLRNVTVRPRYGQHPRLSILGPLEARLIQADTVILGGLNEGAWPPEIAADPWMSRPMKKKFGLPAPEHRAGLAAHDFVQLASANEVVLTRARRAGNAPTVPSRFLLQLETVLRALGYSNGDHSALTPQTPWATWARMIDEPAAPPRPCGQPNPRPPVALRPRQLSVTEIGTWQRNPYAIYAKHILGLRKLDPLDAEIDAADRGTIIHATLDRFLEKYLTQLPNNALDELLAIGKDVFAAYDEHPQVQAFWWPRFERIASWFITNEHERRQTGINTLQTEASGKVQLGDFTLKGRADRIDRLPDGTLAIIDYKTGGTPKVEDVKQGLDPQLPLLAMIAAEGGFDKLPAGNIGELAYWKLTGGRNGEDEQKFVKDLDTLIDEAKTGLQNLIIAFADPATPYHAVPKPNHRPRFDDYAHLARLAEWGRTSEDG